MSLQRNLTCGPCGNRRFNSRDILLHHVKTSSHWHPTCAKCERRFTSSVAYEAHMSSKHPLRFRCSRCCKDFAESFQLQDHFRGSEAHPNCPRCGKGFSDEDSMNAHRTTAHIKVVCEPCRETVYEEDLVVHYTKSTSGNHPKCPACEIGCKDEVALQEHAQTHIESATSIAEEAAQGGGVLPNPPTLVSDAVPLTLDVHSPTTSLSKRFPFLETASPINTNVGGPNDPDCTRRNELPLEMPIAAQASSTAWGSNRVANLPAKPWGHLPKPLIRKDLLVQDELRTDTPPLRLSTSFSSPIMDVPQPGNLYSPVNGLAPPSPELNRAWTSKANRVTADTTKAFTSASLVSLSNALIAGPWKTASHEKKLPGLGEPEWRKSSYAKAPAQSIETTLVGDSSTSSWLNSRLRLRESSRLGATSPDSSASWFDSSPAKVLNGKENTAALVSTRDVVKWRAQLGEEAEKSDLTQTPRALSPTKAKGEGMGSSELHTTAEDNEANKGIGDKDTDARGKGSVLAGHEYKERTVASPGDNTSTESSQLSGNGRDALPAQMESPTTTASTSRSSCAGLTLSPLHCRQCKAESCDDITATMCGHLFCYECITSAVITTSKCPVCSTPTLLYCLFRLDLSA